MFNPTTIKKKHMETTAFSSPPKDHWTLKTTYFEDNILRARPPKKNAQNSRPEELFGLPLWPGVQIHTDHEI